MKLSAAEEAFERWRKIAGIVLAPLVAWLAFYAAGQGTVNGTPLSFAAQKLSGILGFIAILWMTETIPLPATALLAGALCVIFGVSPAKDVLAFYADPIVFLFIGSFMLARAMTIHRLDRRIALTFLSIPGIAKSPIRVLSGMGLVTAVLSMWVSNSATTSMMLPVAIGVLGALHQVRVSRGEAVGEMNPRTWTFANGMMLMVGYASAVGGVGTLVGSPPNLICLGLLQKDFARQGKVFDISFLNWMVLMVPFMIVMLSALVLLMHRLHPQKVSAGGAKAMSESVRTYVRRERADLGPWTAGQINTLIAFGVAVMLWVFPGILALPIWGSHADDIKSLYAWFSARVPEAIGAIVAALLLFMLPTNMRKGEFTIDWKNAVQIDWGTILLFGGGLALGTLMFNTGVANAMGEAMMSRLGVSSVWSITAFSIAIGIILSEATSNTAASNMVIPVVIGICNTTGISPIPPALGACLGASFGFMLPVSTPPNAIVYGSGLVSIPSMMRAGIIFDILGFFIIFIGLRIMCPLLNLM